MLYRIFLVALGLWGIYLCWDIGGLALGRWALADAVKAYGSGPAGADLQVVEFTEYTCPECREMHPALMEAIRQDGKVFYAPVPLSVDNAGSWSTTTLVYAAAKQGKFREMDAEMTNNFRTLSESVLEESAQTTGTDAAKLKADMQSRGVQKTIRKNLKMFHRIGGKGVPSFLIGGKILYVPHDYKPGPGDFLNLFEEARKLQ